MKGIKEIVLSFSLALATFLAFAEVRKLLLSKERYQTQEEPAAILGESEDPHLSLNWGVQQIHAASAWRKHPGSRDVIVAVIDTGCDVHHPELRNNIWTNPGESGLDADGNPKASNGIDDDDNGYVDDFHGWNFSSNTSDISDEHGHGTHIAGIIGGQRLNGLSSSGVAPHVSLMILKYFDTESSGKDNLDNTIRAIRYAVHMGAAIINYSGGGVMRSQQEEATLKWAAAQGVLVVAAAGNEGLNSDFFHFYPADYELNNILSVAAIDQHGDLLRMSNFGVNTVDLAAPGKNIYSTLPGGAHGYMSGTSQATAFVSGVAALLIANDQRMGDPSALIQHLLANSSPRTILRNKLRSGGLLDAKLALDSSDVNLAQVAARNNRAPARALSN